MKIYKNDKNLKINLKLILWMGFMKRTERKLKKGLVVIL